MGFTDVLTLPYRLSVAATRATLEIGQLAAPSGPIRRPGGYADQFAALVGPGGLAEQITKLLSDPNGPVALLQRLAAVTADDRPLGQAMAPGGALDHMLDQDGVAGRLTEPGGPIDRLLDEGGMLETLIAPGGPLERLLSEGGAFDRITAEAGPLDRMLSEDGALDRLTEPGGPIDRLLTEGGLAETLQAEGGFLEKLTAEGGTLDQLVALGDTIDRLQDAVQVLNAAVVPLSDLAGRIPGTRARRRPIRGSEVYTQIDDEDWPPRDRHTRH